MYFEDTIAAVSTPPGSGGIGIIRVSGSLSEKIGLQLFHFCSGSAFTSHYLHYGTIIDPRTGNFLDEVMVVLMRAPRSYTREDVLEIHAHGSPLALEQILLAVLQSGARLAEPGEFTRRAFLNGRINLLEAEAVMDVISSRSAASLALARKQQEGSLSLRIAVIRDMLLNALALIEAYIDFPEDDLGDADTKAIRDYAVSAHMEIEDIIACFDEGRIIRDGVAVLIVGKPNVGKSSLLNCLLGEQRAIVTHIPGTTRDIIEETASFDGLAIRLLDTAGIRNTDDIVEREGINRALECIPLADLVLFVLDTLRPFDHEDIQIFDMLSGKRILVVSNKCDLALPEKLPVLLSDYPHYAVSTVTGQGLDTLKSAIRTSFVRQDTLNSHDFVAISQVRHRNALVLGNEILVNFLTGMDDGRAFEVLSIDLRDALHAVGQITGETTTEDVLDIIFSSFCIGK